MVKEVLVSSYSRSHVLEYISKKKEENPGFSVIDVGGYAEYTSWSHSVTDYIVNFEDCDVPGKKIFTVNLNFESQWDEIHKFVEKNGKFDFCICSHTLEDLALPAVTLQKLPQIAKEGFISTPTKYRELSRIANQPWLGYIHHRWIFTFDKGIFLGLPKLNFLEFFEGIDQVGNLAQEVADLSFFWSGSIPFKILNNDFMGPNVQDVISYYEILFNDDLGIIESLEHNLPKQ